MIEPWRTLGWSTWLGWQIESNWANLKLFVLYLIVKPITGSMMLVCMFYAAQYAAAAGGQAGRVPVEFLPYMYISSACYGLVGAVMFGMSSVVITDRESYRMLKYIFISPAHFQTYFLGRGLAKALEGTVGGMITLAAGMSLPPIRDALTWANFQPLNLLVYLGLGAVLLWSCGMLLASAMLNMTRSGSFLSEGIAGVVYLLSGVVFPLSVLPGWLQAIGLSLPTTYWLEGMRRSLVGLPPDGSPLAGSPLTRWSDGQLMLSLLATTLVTLILSQLFYRYSLNKAWRAGKIEEVTGL
ncbi:MAG: ABC transporter permease [Fimbriiglobus sp.]